MRGLDDYGIMELMGIVGYTYTINYHPPPEIILETDRGELNVQSKPIKTIKPNHTVTSKPRFRHMTMRRGN